MELYTENLQQPLNCEVEINEFGNGQGKYIGGFDLGDPIHVRMLGMRNTDVHNFEITEINEDNIIAIHPTSGNEYKIGFDIEVSYGQELRFRPYDKESNWFAFEYLDARNNIVEGLIKSVNEELETIIKEG